jgi:hypothetical protein
MKSHFLFFPTCVVYCILASSTLVVLLHTLILIFCTPDVAHNGSLVLYSTFLGAIQELILLKSIISPNYTKAIKHSNLLNKTFGES